MAEAPESSVSTESEPMLLARGLVRTFEVDGHDGSVAFVTDASEGVRYAASVGTWDGNVLRLTPEEAAQCSITMTAEED